MYTTDGRKIFDLRSAHESINLGFRHPKVLAVMREQMEKVVLNPCKNPVAIEMELVVQVECSDILGRSTVCKNKGQLSIWTIVRPVD